MMPEFLESHKAQMIVLILAIVLISQGGRADAMLAILGNDGVVLATDRLQIDTVDAASKECNIRQAGNVFWAATGVESDTTTGFKVARFFNDRSGRTTGASQVLDDVGGRILPSLQAELLSLERNSPDLYGKVIHEGAILSLVAVFSDGDQIEAYAKEFLVVNKQVVPTSSHSCLPADGQPACILLSRNPEVEQYAVKHLNLFTDNAVGFIDRLMKIGQDSDPRYSGPPFNILSVTKTGAEWLRQNDCKPIKLWLRHSDQIASIPTSKHPR
jgi:hypothetical protein